MEVNRRERLIGTFAQLGKLMGHLAQNEPWPGYGCGLAQSEYEDFEQLITTHFQYNGWFTAANIRKALGAWSTVLATENLQQWLKDYPAAPSSARQVGIICAGNIPMVGFHDVLSVILAGHKALIKLSSDDNKLIPTLLACAEKWDPELKSSYSIIPQKLTGFEAVIATGSSNTSRYFHYYFKDIPHIIRKGRTSLAILSGNESDEQIQALGNDIFDYFGLGCRSVSKIFIPEDFPLDRFFGAIYSFNDIVNHNKYANNYDYNKAVWLLNQEQLLDNGFILLKEEKALASPTASLYYERYTDINALHTELEQHAEQIQCIVAEGKIPFGHSQQPALWDYADNVDTMKFLMEL